MYQVLILSNICNSSSTWQNKPAPANGRRAAPRKEEAQTGVRSSAGAVKVAAVLKPIRGKSSHVKTNLKTAANDSAQLEKKSVAIGPTLSTSTSSLGSELVEEGPLDSPRKAVQEVPDKQETAEGVEPSHPSEDVREESVGDQREASGKALITEAAVEKPRNPSRVSTMSMLKYV